MAQINALIRFFYKTNPNKMSDNEWCKASEEITWVLNFTGQIHKIE